MASARGRVEPSRLRHALAGDRSGHASGGCLPGGGLLLRRFPRRCGFLFRRLLFALALLLRRFLLPRPLDQGDRRGITMTDAELDDPRISSGSVAKSRREHLKELGHRGAVTHAVEGAPARVQRRLLAEGHEAVSESAKLLRLGVRRTDSLVPDQRGGEVPQERLPMRARAVELTTRFLMSHGLCALFFLLQP